MERVQGQASTGWRRARATAPGQPQLPALCVGSLGKGGLWSCQPHLGRAPACRGRLAPLPPALCCTSARGAPCLASGCPVAQGPGGSRRRSSRLPLPPLVNRKSTSSSDLLFGSEAARGIPPPLLTALQTPNTIPVTAWLLWPPYPSERALSPSRAGAGGVRTWWGCTCQAGAARLGEASIKQPLGMEIPLERGEGMHGQAYHSSEHGLVAQCQGAFQMVNVGVTIENVFFNICM